ncbi:MAG: 2-C-methyl-D-erythritol 2,4-cyclodiphosphate synthase [Candidatus Sericytochromatia bacterium]|nr:2-C-methyl-D-erythritol 2,4-cyclodiphosphate synthase [Candidatus Sericytochromatia bacterium]
MYRTPACRIGSGYDVHAFREGRPLVLGGVTLPGETGLDGDSDADVATHALMDALLGALALGDLGTWFPPGDPRFKGASSLDLLDVVSAKVQEAGWMLGNADLTIVAQRPRLKDLILPMRETLAARLQVPVDAVSLKATTPDHLGAIGRVEGIAAQAMVLLHKAMD